MRILNVSSSFVLLSLFIVGLVTACSRAEATTVPQSTVTSAIAQTRSPATIEPSVTPAPTKPPEPPAPSILGRRQVLGDDGQLSIDRIVADQEGWAVVYIEEDGQRGEILGYAAVSVGESVDVFVTIDPLQAGDALLVALHADGGESGVFEFPGPDHPLENDSQPVEDHFTIDNRATIPAIAVSDQEVGEDGIITIDYVATSKPGWLVLQLDELGQPGEMVAYTRVMAGISEQLTLAINWREATATLHAMLYEDVDAPGIFEAPGIDLPVHVEGEQVAATFDAVYPPDIYVIHQPVVEGSIVIERAVSYGPGWLVIYFDDDGGLGNIIGQASLHDGINERVAISIVESAVTPILHLVLHQDTDEIGEFEFPRADPPVRHSGLVPNSVTFNIDAGNYLVTRDQLLSSSSEVVISLAVVDVSAWLSVYSDDDGEIGDMIGQKWLPPGVHREVAIRIDPELATATLKAVLHLDAGRPREFEYPEGPDIRLMRNQDVISSPFSLLADGDRE